MFPLSNRKLIRGCAAHIKAGLSCGVDYVADYVPFFIPFDGKVETYWGNEGGNWLRLTRPNGDKIELAHLSKYHIKSGNAVAGRLGGVTGNTGAITTGAHLHIQIIRNGKRLDPEQYEWESFSKTFMKITIVANKNNWTTLPQKLEQLKQMFITYSSGKFEPVFDVKQTNFDTVPLVPFQGLKAVDVAWYRENITPLATGEATVLLLNPDQYQNTAWGFMTYGDPEKPVRCEVMATENDGNIFEERTFHEICHALQFLTGQPDRTHELLYQNPPKFKNLMDYIDYPKLQAKLLTIKPMPANQAKVVKSKTSPKVYVVYEMPSMEYLNTKANIEGFSVPATLPNTDTL